MTRLETFDVCFINLLIGYVCGDIFNSFWGGLLASIVVSLLVAYLRFNVLSAPDATG